MRWLLVYFLLMLRGVWAYDTPHEVCSSPRVILVENFLSEEECDYLMQLAYPHLRRSKVLKRDRKELIHTARTSQGMFLNFCAQDPSVVSIEQRIAQLTNTPQEHGEPMQVLRYQLHEEYQLHYDFFNPHTESGKETLQRGGQRIATVLMYLQEPLRGGETFFPYLNLHIRPKRGRALVFYNLTPEGWGNTQTRHASLPVREGEKWVATRWIRQGPFL